MATFLNQIIFVKEYFWEVVFYKSHLVSVPSYCCFRSRFFINYVESYYRSFNLNIGSERFAIFKKSWLLRLIGILGKWKFSGAAWYFWTNFTWVFLRSKLTDGLKGYRLNFYICFFWNFIIDMVHIFDDLEFLLGKKWNIRNLILKLWLSSIYIPERLLNSKIKSLLVIIFI